LALLGWAAVAWGGIRRGAAEAESNAQGSREAGPGAAGRETRRDLLCLLVPPLAILALVSSQTGFNHHLRYVLPAYPFAFVFIGRLAGGLRRGRAWGAAVWILAFCTAAESMMVYPHSASFFNFLVGGPRHGAEHVLDSNISWLAGGASRGPAIAAAGVLRQHGPARSGD
jgi:hypothetical protein